MEVGSMKADLRPLGGKEKADISVIVPGCFQTSLDFREFMKLWPNESVDLVITDPPYPMQFKNKEMSNSGFFDSKNYSSQKGKSTETFYDTLSPEDLNLFIQECYRVLKESTHFFIMTNEKNLNLTVKFAEEAGFSLKNKIIWIKRRDWSDGTAMGRYFLNAFEYVVFFSKGDIQPINTKMNVFVKKPQTRGMNAKPEELYAHCIDSLMTADKIAIDPFAGSDPLARAKMRGLIQGETYSNVFGTTEGNDPAKWGRHLKNNLNQWGMF